MGFDTIADLVGVVVNGASGGAFGGIVGLLGGAISAYTKGKQIKADRAWEKEKWAHEERLHTLATKSRQQETESEIQIASSVGAWNGLEAAVAADAAIPTSGWVANIKALYRPFLTTMLFVMVYLLWMDITGGESSLDVILSPEEIKDLASYIVFSVVFMASSAGGFWFGERGFSPNNLKHR